MEKPANHKRQGPKKYFHLSASGWVFCIADSKGEAVAKFKSYGQYQASGQLIRCTERVEVDE